jgi:hypothetical protein
MIYSLDFVSFTTAQPTLGTCTDTFMVGGSISSVPTICGDNPRQHSISQTFLKNSVFVLKNKIYAFSVP